MPHYFFTLRGPDREFPDEEGTNLPDESAARAMATQIVREVKEDEHCPPGFSLVVTDEAGAELFVVSFDYLH